MMYARLLALGTMLAAGGLILGQDGNPLQKALKDFDVQGDWIYNDLPKGYAEAKKTGKPLLVVFR